MSALFRTRRGPRTEAPGPLAPTCQVGTILGAADLIRRALVLMDERGWWGGGKRYPKEPTLCAVTALQEAARETNAFADYRLTYDVLSQRVGGQVGKWNDSFTRPGPVVRVLVELEHELRRAGPPRETEGE